MVTVIEGPSCASVFKALEGLYRISRAAVERAVMMSRTSLASMIGTTWTCPEYAEGQPDDQPATDLGGQRWRLSNMVR
jgi:hypothetical protein